MAIKTPLSELNLSDDLKEIYFLLMKKSPLTIGELVFLTKKPDDKIKNSLKKLIEAGFVREIEDTISLYLAIFPSLFLNSNLESFLKNLNEFDAKFKEKNKAELTSLLSELDSIKTEYHEKSNELIKSYDTIHSVAKQDLENQSQTLIKNTLQTQTETLKEVSNELSEQRTISSNNLSEFSTSIADFFETINSKFGELLEHLQNLTGQNKKQLRKSIFDTVKSLDEGAKLLGKNVNDQLKSFEGKLIDSINATISSTVELSTNFKDQLTEDYSTWRVENSDFVNNLESNNESFISESINSNMNILNSSIGKVVEKLLVNIDSFSKILSELAKKSLKSTEEKSILFLKEIENYTITFTESFKENRANIDENINNYNLFLADYEKSLNNEMKSYLATSFQNFEDNFKILNQILSDFINNARNSFDKEYLQILTQDSDILDRIGETLSNLKENYENELTNLQNNIGGLENNIKDLSVAVKRRLDKFSSEASSKLLSIGNKIIDELLNIQGSNIDLINSYKAVKSSFENALTSLVTNNDSLIVKSQNDFETLSKKLLETKESELEQMDKEIKDYSIFITDRYSILDNQLKSKNAEFINDFKSVLSKIREDAQVIIQTEQVEYLKNLSEINSNSDILINQEKDNVLNSLDGIANSLSKSLQEALDNITQTITKLKTSIVTEINTHKTSFSDTFNNINSEVEQISNNYINNYKNVLESSVSSLKNVEVTYWSKFEDVFGKNKEKVLEIYKTNSENLQNKANSVIKSLSIFLDDTVTSLTSLNTEISDSVGSFSTEMKGNINEIQEQTGTQFKVFEDLSNSLDQLSQKSKLEVEKDLLDVEDELKIVVDKNFESYATLLSSSTNQISKSLANLSEAGGEQINTFEKELLNNIQLIKTENETNREEHSNLLANISKDSLNDLNTRNSKQISIFKESKLQLEEKSQLLTEEMISKLKENQKNLYENIGAKFDVIQETIPERMKDYFADFRNSTKELLESLNQNFFKDLTDNVTTIASTFKNTQGESQKSLQQALNGLKEDFSEQLSGLKDEFMETSKLRLEEIEAQVNKELEAFQSKLVKKENDDVRKLRDLIQSINSVGIFNELVNENLITKIDPLKDSFDNTLSVFQTEFENQLHTSGIKDLNDIQQKTINDFGTLLVNAYNTSIGKLNLIQKSFTGEMNDFQINVKSFLEKTIETSRTSEIALLKENDEKIINLQESQSQIISNLIKNIISSFEEHNSKLNTLIADYNQFFNTLHTVLVNQDNDSDTLYKSRLINVSDDISKYLEDVISKTNKRVDLIIPKPENLDLKSILDLHTRVRIKIVVNLDPKSDKNDKRKTWVHDLYKKKANVQLYDSNAISNLIICIRDNAEVIVVPDKSNNEYNPGFVIENNLFADFFSKAIVNNIILSASPITRENQK